MANPEHVAKLKEGVEAWNAWRRGLVETPDLIGADLHGMDLARFDTRPGVNLRSANLAHADLQRAYLHRAEMQDANLRNGNLSEADLGFANLSDADLSGARFFGSDLIHTQLSGAKLHHAYLIDTTLRSVDLAGADLSSAKMSGTAFIRTNLVNVIGLESCSHGGPSALDFQTLAKSGPLPLPFLRGCGLPDKIIDYLPSLLQNVIQFDSCFISHSTKDKEFADRLHVDLQDNGVRCWFAPHDIQGGKKIHKRINEAIRIYDRLLLILSEYSMNSEWVKTEIAKARQKEITQQRRVLFPISLVPYDAVRQWNCFDADTGKDSAREIREYFIPDFSQWKHHDSYQAAFDRLLKDLRSEAPKDAQHP
jgi:hypothetical protein